jgi:hypothetical protein
MHHLNDGNEPTDPKAKKLIKERLDLANEPGQYRPKHIGQWLQVTYRDIFNRDFELHVAAQGLTKHPLSK